MKSPEYVFNVTRLYRQILDRGEGFPRGSTASFFAGQSLAFPGRRPRGGCARPAGESLIEQRYPGHRGASLGTVEAVQGREILLRLEAELSIRDGVGFFLPGVDEPVIFSVARIRKAGRRRSSRALETGWALEVPAETSGGIPDRARRSAISLRGFSTCPSRRRLALRPGRSRWT